jgi:geranylgeranyl pyrophosphate synthase
VSNVTERCTLQATEWAGMRRVSQLCGPTARRMDLGRISTRLGHVYTLISPARDALHHVHETISEELSAVEDVRDLVGALTAEEGDVDDLFGELGRSPRIRPMLVVLAAKATGAAEVNAEVQYASELLYLALVIHDFAVGQKGGRRRRAARRLFGRSIGWIGGNQLSLRALELARHASSPEVLHDLVGTLGEFADAQSLARELEGGTLPTRDDWFEHADNHTGALFAFCCRAGGHVGAATPTELASLERYGRHLGRMWHAAEDMASLRGENGPQHLVGRSLLGRPMLPLVCAAEIDGSIAEQWRRLAKTPSDDLAESLTAALTSVSVTARCREVLAKEGWSARRPLNRLTDTAYRAGLDHLASGLVRCASTEVPQRARTESA